MGTLSLLHSIKLFPRLFFGLCLLLAAAAAPAQSEGQRVNKIQIEGLSGYRPAQILPHLKVQTGKPYNSVDASADLTYLSHLMRTATVRTGPDAGGGVTVTYAVSEFPRFRKLQVIGNNKVTAARIESLAKLKAGDVLDSRVQSSLLRALREEYRVIGMPQARIGLNLIDVPADPKAERTVPQADLQISINEGTQVLCKDVIVTGNHAFTAIRLRMQINTKGSLGFIKNYYDEETFRTDLANLRKFYADHGYFDAHVDRGIFKEEPGGKMATISPVIQIREGARYTFGKATVRGARLFSQADVAAPFKGLEGQPYEGKHFEAALKELLALYQDHGLLTTEIEPKYEYDVDRKVLNMTIAVGEKDRIFVGKIKVVHPPDVPDDEKGWFGRWYAKFSPPVKEETVLREVLLKPGEVYNKRLELDSMRRLARLDIFNNDKLRAYNEPSGEPGVHNMVIEYEETVTGSINGGVGYGDVTGPFVFASFSEHNIGGQADAFTLQALLGTRDSSLVASYLDRHLRGGDNTLETRLYLLNRLNPGYRATTVGVSTELGHPLTPEWTAYVRPRLEWVRLSHRSGYDDTAEDLDQSYPVGTGRLRLVQDTRFPLDGHYREGYIQSAGLEAGYAGGPLMRLEAARDQYFPLTKDLTYRVNAFGGMMPYDRGTVPINERYFLGGDTDMRGFKYRGAGYFDRKEDRVPIGGAAKFLVQNELQYPIYDPVSGVAFFDVGDLGKSPLLWQAPRASTGLGLRFDLGGSSARKVQVALDFAVPLLMQPDDQKRYFHFRLQGQF